MAGPPGLRRLLSSPRRRRRLATAAVLLAIGAGLALLGIFFSNTGHAPKMRITAEPPQLVAPTPKTVPLSASDRDAARAIAERFIYTAVIRRHTGDSWDLMAPSMKHGYTRATWSRGEIPVVPFPADALGLVKYQIDYSFRDRIGMKVALVPKPNSNADGIAANIELQRNPSSPADGWLVDYYATSGIGVSHAVLSGHAPSTPPLTSRLNPMFLIVPIGLLGGLIVLVPALLAARGWYRQSRATRAYEAEVAAWSQTSSSSPS